MTLYMDVHENLPEGTTPEALAQAHAADVAVQDKHGVTYLKYWLAEDGSKGWCLVEAPSPEAANAVHAESHGLVADSIFPVIEG